MADQSEAVFTLSTQIQVENVRPGAGGKALSPSPSPPITPPLSWEAREFTPTTPGPATDQSELSIIKTDQSEAVFT